MKATVSSGLAKLAGAWLVLLPVCQAATNATDICVYGGTSGGVVAAVQAARMGKSVSLVVFNKHLGGMTSGGLGWTDYGNKNAIGGIALEFYERIGTKYGSGTPRYTFEPHVAEDVFDEMVAEAGVAVYTNRRLDSVSLSGTNIVALRMEDGDVFSAGMFIDATYEGDLMARAGVSYTVGREANSRYGEVANGVVNPPRTSHNFDVAVDPYVTPGDPTSGLLPLIEDGGTDPGGTADNRVQAYNYRMCLTTTATNRLPIEPPAGYNPTNYTVLARYIAAKGAVTLSNFLKIDSVGNGKTDINNNGPVSTDFIGRSREYPDADYTRREEIRQAHEDYIRGLLHYLGNDTNVPANVRSSMLTYGLCKDEFPDTGGWPHQLYVREARRMVADYVMTEANCRNTILPYDGIGLGSYTMDSHNCHRYVDANGNARNEGDVQNGVSTPYGIAYRALVPRREECGNLLVPWSLSASHIAFGSIRMEPVFMILGQSAATAAALALDAGVTVQDVSVTNLQARLVSDGQLVAWDAAANDRPFAELTQPRMDAVFAIGGSIVMAAEAWDPTGTVARVEFYGNGLKLGEDDTAPYAFVWPTPYTGRIALYARVVNSAGTANQSGVIAVQVGTSNDLGTAENGIIVDNTDSGHVMAVGTWATSSSVAGYYGSNYAHDNNTGLTEHKSFRFTPELPVAGLYNVFLRFSMNANRASNVPVDILHAGGVTTQSYNQRLTGLNGQWIFAGAYTCLPGTASGVVVRNDAADGYVTADAVSFSIVTTNSTPTNATAVVTEYFNGYGANTVAALDGLDGGGGWAGPWVSSGGNPPGYEPDRVTSYDVPDYISEGNLAGPSHGRARITAGDAYTDIARRDFAMPMTGTIWVSLLARHESNSQGELLLWLDTAAQGTGAKTFVGLRSGDVPTMRYGGTDITNARLSTASQNLLLLARIALNAVGTNDTLSLWIKTEQDDIRSEAKLGVPLLSSGTSDILGTNLTFIGLSGGGADANVDAIRISNRQNGFEDVVMPVTRPVLYTTAFPEAANELPVDWTPVAGAAGTPGWRIDTGGDLRFDQSGVNGIITYAGELSAGDAAQITNGIVETVFRKSDPSHAGFVARLRDADNYYTARLISQTELGIYRFIDNVPVRLGASVTITDTYHSGEAWRLRFAFRGNVLVADLFNDGDVLVGRAIAADSTYSSGFVGLRGSNASAFETFSVAGYATPRPPDGMFILVR